MSDDLSVPVVPPVAAVPQDVSRNVRIVSICTVISRILGLLRDSAMAAVFGKGPILDAFTVAFRIPNISRSLLGEGVMATAFLPAFQKELHEHGPQAASRLTSAIFCSLLAVLALGVIVAELVLWFAIKPWIATDEARLLRDLLGIMLPYVILICLTAQLAAALNALHEFTLPALISALMNLVWLASLGVVWATVGDPVTQIKLISAGLVVAGLLQMLMPVPRLWQLGIHFQPDWRLALPKVRQILMEMLPILIGLSITQLNSLVDSAISWGFTQPVDGPNTMSLPGSPAYPLTVGTTSALYLGQRLYQFPLGVFGVALGTVLYPLLTQHAQRCDWERLREDLSLGVRLVLAIGIPASLGLVLVADPLATACFQQGKFTEADALETARMIQAYGVGVWAYCGLIVIQRGFYAVGDRWTPMKLGYLALLLNLVLNLTIIWWLGGVGLALTTSIVASLQTAALCWLIQARVGRLNWPAIGNVTLKIVACCAVMTGICLAILEFLPANFADDWHRWRKVYQGIRVAVPVGCGGLGFLVVSKLLGLEEPWWLLRSRKHVTPAE